MIGAYELLVAKAIEFPRPSVIARSVVVRKFFGKVCRLLAVLFRPHHLSNKWEPVRATSDFPDFYTDASSHTS